MKVGVGRGWLAGASSGWIWPKGVGIRGRGEQVRKREEGGGREMREKKKEKEIREKKRKEKERKKVVRVFKIRIYTIFEFLNFNLVFA